MIGLSVLPKERRGPSVRPAQASVLIEGWLRSPLQTFQIRIFSCRD